MIEKYLLHINFFNILLHYLPRARDDVTAIKSPKKFVSENGLRICL